MDFELPDHIKDYKQRVREFVAKHILPLEQDRSSYDHHENIAQPLLEQVRKKVKEAGLWALQMPKEHGGQGLRIVGPSSRSR